MLVRQSLGRLLRHPFVVELQRAGDVLLAEVRLWQGVHERHLTRVYQLPQLLARDLLRHLDAPFV
jgi:hypothetical protein